MNDTGARSRLGDSTEEEHAGGEAGQADQEGEA